MNIPPTVFYTRSRPLGADLVDLVLRERRVFIGYPAWRPDKPYKLGHIRESIVDPTCPDSEWNREMSQQDGAYRPHCNRNRNFVAKIAPGSIALVPRPSLGVVFAGRVQGGFELVDDPPWAQDYLDLRTAQGLSNEDHPDRSHVGDVVQCWQVDYFRPVPLPAIPAWIRRSLFGQSTYRIIRSPEGLDFQPFSALDGIIDQPGKVVRDWTLYIDEIERRLLAEVMPAPFEHLCVALLQLENPDQVWTHVGGSGDGGVDGIGADSHGTVSSLLQCKSSYWGGELDFAAPWGGDSQNPHKRILAALIHPTPVSVPNGVEFWSRRHIASLILKHANSLPMAISMRVGSGRIQEPASGSLG